MGIVGVPHVRDGAGADRGKWEGEQNDGANARPELAELFGIVGTRRLTEAGAVTR